MTSCKTTKEIAMDTTSAKIEKTEHYTFELAENVTRTKVTFRNHFGIELAGDLYAPKDAPQTGNAALALVGTLLSVIIAIAISLIELIGIVNFARKESIGAAFAIGDILAKIGEIGWISLLIQLIVLEIVLGVIYFVLMLIPIVGMLLLLILCPLFAIWEAKYISNVYDNAQ